MDTDLSIVNTLFNLRKVPSDSDEGSTSKEKTNSVANWPKSNRVSPTEQLLLSSFGGMIKSDINDYMTQESRKPKKRIENSNPSTQKRRNGSKYITPSCSSKDLSLESNCQVSQSKISEAGNIAKTCAANFINKISSLKPSEAKNVSGKRNKKNVPVIDGVYSDVPPCKKKNSASNKKTKRIESTYVSSSSGPIRTSPATISHTSGFVDSGGSVEESIIRSVVAESAFNFIISNSEWMQNTQCCSKEDNLAKPDTQPMIPGSTPSPCMDTCFLGQSKAVANSERLQAEDPFDSCSFKLLEANTENGGIIPNLNVESTKPLDERLHDETECLNSSSEGSIYLNSTDKAFSTSRINSRLQTVGVNESSNSLSYELQCKPNSEVLDDVSRIAHRSETYVTPIVSFQSSVPSSIAKDNHFSSNINSSSPLRDLIVDKEVSFQNISFSAIMPVCKKNEESWNSFPIPNHVDSSLQRGVVASLFENEISCDSSKIQTAERGNMSYSDSVQSMERSVNMSSNMPALDASGVVVSLTSITTDNYEDNIDKTLLSSSHYDSLQPVCDCLVPKTFFSISQTSKATSQTQVSWSMHSPLMSHSSQLLNRLPVSNHALFSARDLLSFPAAQIAGWPQTRCGPEEIQLPLQYFYRPGQPSFPNSKDSAQANSDVSRLLSFARVSKEFAPSFQSRGGKFCESCNNQVTVGRHLDNQRVTEDTKSFEILQNRLEALEKKIDGLLKRDGNSAKPDSTISEENSSAEHGKEKCNHETTIQIRGSCTQEILIRGNNRIIIESESCNHK